MAVLEVAYAAAIPEKVAVDSYRETGRRSLNSGAVVAENSSLVELAGAHHTVARRLVRIE